MPIPFPISIHEILLFSIKSFFLILILVSTEQVAGVDLLLHIVQATILAVGNNCLTTLHDTMDRRMPEVVRVRLHGQSVHADNAGFLLRLIIFVVLTIAVVSCHLEHAICNEILTGSVGLDNGLNQILRDIGIVCKQLLGILRQTIATVSKARVVVLVTIRGSRQTPLMICCVFSTFISA